MGRRASTRSIDARSDWAEEDEETDEQKREREKDDEEVSGYVSARLERVKSHASVFDNEDEEYAVCP